MVAVMMLLNRTVSISYRLGGNFVNLRELQPAKTSLQILHPRFAAYRCRHSTQPHRWRSSEKLRCTSRHLPACRPTYEVMNSRKTEVFLQCQYSDPSSAQLPALTDHGNIGLIGYTSAVNSCLIDDQLSDLSTGVFGVLDLRILRLNL